LRSSAAKKPRMPGKLPLPSSMKRCCAGVRSYQGTLVGMPAALRRASSRRGGAVFGGGPGGDCALVERLRLVGDDEVGVEVDGVAEALAARAGAVGIVEGEEARLGLAVGAVAGGALEGGGEAEDCGLAGPSRGTVSELDFAGLAVAGLDGVDDAARTSGLMARRSMRTKMGWVKSSSRRDSGVENSTIFPSGRGGCSRGGGVR
jgi:hypothetical protein